MKPTCRRFSLVTRDCRFSSSVAPRIFRLDSNGFDNEAKRRQADRTPKKMKRNQARTTIAVQGARVHNLKNISLEIPRDQLIVVTGLSGSGKSSLAFDTIYAGGQRS